MKTVNIEIYTYYFLKGKLGWDECGCSISDFVFIDKLKEKLVGDSTLLNTLNVFKEGLGAWYIEIPNLKEDVVKTYIEVEIEVL